MYEHLTYEQQGPVTLIAIDHPERMNAIGPRTHRELVDAWTRFRDDDHAHVAVLTGSGDKAFCAGGDLKAGADGDPHEVTGGPDGVLGPSRWTDLYKPTIAAVNGAAAGFGLALALGSDIRYATPEAVFRAVFLNVGVSNCDMGVSWLLPRLIGASRAHELLLTGRRVSAEEAERIGLVAGLVERDALVARAVAAAEEIAAWSPWGIRLTKQGMWAALEMPSERAAIEYEDRQQIMALHGKAPAEAVGAFLEKRTAEFPD
jgi:enoyl-CoA hydratase